MIKISIIGILNFVKVHIYPTINGFSYGSMPAFHLSANEYIMWNVANLDFKLLPVHFGGNPVVEGHHPRSGNTYIQHRYFSWIK